MDTLKQLLSNNVEWAKSAKAGDPEFFNRLAEQQNPDYLWIGCADSRVPATQILGLNPGEVFVHRNVANVVALDDPNAMSVVQYAVAALKVKHIIVCGHYGCGGVQAALDNAEFDGPISDWLQHIRPVVTQHQAELDALPPEERPYRMCEWNVLAQFHQLCASSHVRNAWENKVPLRIHAWIYDIRDGIIKPVCNSVASADAASLPSG